MLLLKNSVEMPFDYSSVLNQKLEQLRQQGNYRYFLPFKKSAEKSPVFFKKNDDNTEGVPVVNWTMNDYVGMSVDADVINAFVAAAQSDGVGSGGTRNISGTTTRHTLLEKTIADLHQKEAALIFTSAYVANSTAISTLGRAFPDTIIFSDEENHASMIEGVKLSRCEKKIFRHNDLQHLESLLAETDPNRAKIIIFESVYSMSGTIAPIVAICDLAKKYNALTYLDEVHAVGLYGLHGEGVASEQGVADRIDVINGTLAKAYGCVGGYIAANKTLTDYVRSFGEGFIFSSSMPPAVCAAAVASIEKLAQTPRIRDTFHKNVKILRGYLRAAGVDFEENPSHITRIVIGDAKKSRAVATHLFESFGVYLQPINFPTVPRGKEGLRIVVTARHTETQMQALAQALKVVLSA